MKRCIIYILLLLVAPLAASGASATSASSADKLAAEAAKAYQAKEYLKAVTLYTQIKDSIGVSPELYFNLGNAYTQLDYYGPAVVCYSRALRLAPGNSEALSNLRYVEEKVALENEALMADKNLDPTPESASFFGSIRSLAEAPGSNFWAVAAAVFFILFMAGCAVYIFIAQVKMKKIAFFGGLASLLLCLVSISLSFSARRTVLAKDRCVIMVPNTALSAKPSADAKHMVVPLTGGTQLRVLETLSDSVKGDWVKVRLNSDFFGWLPAQDVEVI